MSIRCVDDLRIKKVFFPQMGAASRTLYAEFFSVEESALVRKYSRNLKTVNGLRSKMVDYIPRSLADRHKFVEGEAFKIRQNNLNPVTGVPQVSTRIWFTNEIELRVRQKSDSTPWVKILPTTIENLPPLAPKCPWSKFEPVERRRPFTPSVVRSEVIPVSKETNQTEIRNIYTLLDDNCQE